MTLAFKEYYPFLPEVNTYFKERILSYYFRQVLESLPNKEFRKGDGIAQMEYYSKFTPKIHTAREGRRWKVGNFMHMAYNARSSKYYCFNDGIQCLQLVKKVSHLIIEPCLELSTFSYDYLDTGSIMQIETSALRGNIVVPFPKITIDGKSLNDYQVLDFIRNDGFDNPLYFQMWFSKRFEGQLIQWTDHVYNRY